MKKRIAILSVLLMLPGIVLLAGGTPDDSGQGVMIDGKGLAANGADVVAFFDLADDQKAVPGKPELSYEWQGALWLFDSQENLAKFRQEPERYAPQYGGYCAYAMADGDLVGIDPDAWTMREGKLYLNYSDGIRRKWLDDVADYVRRADERWPDKHRQLLQAGGN